ncbi:MAG TPA: POTRA domain-containing protein [Cyclobacteriaceae bacterium]|nr:POTRA domain-containing protein [Cyclobacteriaceae bacterium]
MRKVACSVIVFFACFLFYTESAKADYTSGTYPDTLSIEALSQKHKGNYLRIGNIIIIGNKKTKPQIILRELDIKQGDYIYSEDLPEILELDRNKIYNLRLFNTVLIRTIEVDAGIIDILIEVSERWFFFPVPLFELADRNFNDWWQNQNHDLSRLNYGVKLYYNNVRGRNESLRLTLQGGFLRNMEVIYRIPYLDKKQQHGISFGFNYSETKNLPYTTVDHIQQFLRTDNLIRKSTGGFLGYTYRKNFYEFHSVLFDFRNFEAADTIIALNDTYFSEGNTFQRMPSITYQYNRDKRDIAAYPLKGYQFFGHISRTGFGFKNEINRIDLSVSYSKFIDLKNGNYFSNFSYLYLSTPNEQPYFSYAALGYKRLFVRGYELYLIEGPQIAMNKTTFKKRIFSGSWFIDAMPFEQFKHLPIAIFLKTYVDFGYVTMYPNYQQDYFLNNRLLTGTGIGLDFVSSYDSVLRLEYSFTSLGTGGFFFHVKREF